MQASTILTPSLSGDNTHDRTHLISQIAAGLVAILAALAFILSYSSLQHLAELHQVGPRLSYAWPLLLDFAMVVFSLAILRANLRSEPAWYPWSLTGAFAALATVANVLDVTALGLPAVAIAAAVKALAPVALVLAFELLMGMIRAEIKRADVVRSLAELRTQAAALGADLETQRGALVDLTAKRDAVKSELAALRAERKAEQYTGVGDETRDKARSILTERSDISGAELARLLGKSDTLARRLKRELLPVVVNGNGHQNGGE